MKVSIITPTIRLKGLNILKECLSKQTFKDAEWLIGSPFDPKIKRAIWVKDDFKEGLWHLNRIYNKLIQTAKGELIISLQDFVWISPTGLEQFWNDYQKTKGVISGVGDQYERLNKWGKPEIKIWADPRKRSDEGSFYECEWVDGEWNWCAVSHEALVKIGGFDEEMDFRCRGVDAFETNERLQEIGYKFYLDQHNESFTLRHGRENYGGEEAWQKSHGLFNGEYQKRKKELKSQSKWPYLDYLR